MQRKLLSLAMAALLAIPIVPMLPTSPAQAQCFDGDWGIQGCGNFGNNGNNSGYNNNYGGRRRNDNGWGGNPHRNWGNGGYQRPRYERERPRHNGWGEGRPRYDNFRPRHREERRRPRWQHRSDNGYNDNGTDLALAGLLGGIGAGLIVGTMLNQPDNNYQRPADFNPQGRVYDETDLTCRWITYNDRSVQFVESGESWNVSSGSFCMPSPVSNTALYRLQNGRTTEVQFLN